MGWLGPRQGFTACGHRAAFSAGSFAGQGSLRCCVGLSADLGSLCLQDGGLGCLAGWRLKASPTKQTPPTVAPRWDFPRWSPASEREPPAGKALKPRVWHSRVTADVPSSLPCSAGRTTSRSRGGNLPREVGSQVCPPWGPLARFLPQNGV